MSFPVLPLSLPDVIPEILPSQQFQLGDSVYWHQVPNPDFGRIIGVFYTHEASCTVTGLHYLILLDENSPSYSIAPYDFAFSKDIKVFDGNTLKVNKK